jgi:UDP-N-acetyl-D-glucosamine dehydrogenase
VTIKQDLIGKFKDKSALIGILGLGYVGLPLLLRFSEVGYRVLGIDIDQYKVDKLNAGESYIEHIDDAQIAKYAAQQFHATTDFSQAAECDALILCVPTPLTICREPDLSYVLDTVNAVLPYVREGQVVSLESTTYPGTTDEVLQPLFEKAGRTIGEDLFLVYSPEREDPGNQNFSTLNIPKVCGGVSQACGEVGQALYEGVIETVVPVSSTRVAEMTKLLENIHRSVNIGLVNEMKIVADKMGIDIHEVIHAAATKPFGFVPYLPGPGIGGHCIPIDPFYLTWKAREYGIHTRFIELAGEVNSYMPHWVVKKISDGLNDHGKPIKDSRILILGIAYKKNVDDMRESPSLAVMEELQSKGAKLEYSDPHVPKMPPLRKHDFRLSSVELSPEVVSEYDCVVLCTAHKAFPYEMILENARLVVDTRGAFHKESAANLIKA